MWASRKVSICTDLFPFFPVKPKSPQNLTFLWEQDKVIIEYKPPFSLRCFILEYQYKSDFAEDWVCVRWNFLLHRFKGKGDGNVEKAVNYV